MWIRALAIFLILIIGIETATIVQLSETLEIINLEPELKQNICLTNGCNETAQLIRDSLDENVNPCDNFYEFACGKFSKNSIIPDDKKELSNFVLLQERVYDQLFTILNENPEPNESHAITLAKHFFRSCMDQDASEERGTYNVILLYIK